MDSVFQERTARSLRGTLGDVRASGTLCLYLHAKSKAQASPTNIRKQEAHPTRPHTPLTSKNNEREHAKEASKSNNNRQRSVFLVADVFHSLMDLFLVAWCVSVCLLCLGLGVFWRSLWVSALE